MYLRLIGLRRWLRLLAWRATHRGHDRVCPACGASVSRFAPYGVRQRPDAQCPSCGSLERHRALILFLGSDPAFEGGALRILAVAPDPYLERIGPTHATDYLSIDLAPGRAMAVMDLTDLRLPTGDRDLVIAFHVLEHIENDAAAMGEIARVLSPAGRALLEVPIQGDDTDERFLHGDVADRIAAYGQADHVRLYGRRDLERRLTAAGLSAEAVVVGERLGDDVVKAGLDPREVFYVARPAIAEH